MFYIIRVVRSVLHTRTSYKPCYVIHYYTTKRFLIVFAFYNTIATFLKIKNWVVRQVCYWTACLVRWFSLRGVLIVELLPRHTFVTNTYLLIELLFEMLSCLLERPLPLWPCFNIKRNYQQISLLCLDKAVYLWVRKILQRKPAEDVTAANCEVAGVLLSK